MSVKVMSLVWENFNRGGSEKLAMLALADWCNDEGGSLHPSISGISKKINVSESQARRIIHKFIDEGYLTVIANHDGGNPGQSRHYKLNVNLLKISTPSMDATPRISDTPRTHATPSANATPSMDAHDPLHGCARPLAPMTPEPPLTIIEPSIKEIINKEKPDLLRESMPEVTDQTFKDFLKLRKAKKAPLTIRAIDGIKNEAIKAGISLEAALIECCARGWVGFKADWYQKTSVPMQRGSPVIPIDRTEYNKQQTELAKQKLFGNSEVRQEKDVTNG